MAEWIIGFIEQYGYVAIVALMALENIFPPLPSELIMPFAGFSAAQGSVSFVGVVVAGTCGSLLGTLPWYAAGRWLGSERLDRFIDRHGRWITITHDELEHARRWFERHGTPAVLFGRMVPAVRTVISVPAGVTRMAAVALSALVGDRLRTLERPACGASAACSAHATTRSSTG